MLKHCGLFYLDGFTPKAEELHQQYVDELQTRRSELIDRRKNISRRSEVQARAVNVGFILERLAPSLRTFRFDCTDCRSLFDPIDYIIFEGLCDKGKVSKILFADIKTGNARLTSKQREIRDLVRRKKVEFDVYEAMT